MIIRLEAPPAMMRMLHLSIEPSMNERKDDEVRRPRSAAGTKHNPIHISCIVILPLKSRAPKVIASPIIKTAAMEALSAPPGSFLYNKASIGPPILEIRALRPDKVPAAISVVLFLWNWGRCHTRMTAVSTIEPINTFSADREAHVKQSTPNPAPRNRPRMTQDTP